MRILHTMLRVGDLDRSLAFYTGVLGMKLISRKDYPEGKFTLAFLGFDDREDGEQGPAAELELTHNWETSSYELGTAYGHIALEVTDAHAACDDVTAKGGKVVRPAGPMKHGSRIIAFVEDPDGYKIEFIQLRTAVSVAPHPVMTAETPEAPKTVAVADAAQPLLIPAEPMIRAHRTVIGQDVSYRQDPNEQTYTYTIYAEHHGNEVLFTSDDGWYGVKTVTLDDDAAAAALYDRVVANPKPTLQEIYGEPCAWFEALPAAQRQADVIDPILPTDDDVTVTLLPPVKTAAGTGR